MNTASALDAGISQQAQHSVMMLGGSLVFFENNLDQVFCEARELLCMRPTILHHSQSILSCACYHSKG